MRVQVNGNFDGGFQAAHQMIGVKRGQQTRHIFNAERINAKIFQLPGKVDVTVDIVDGAHRITECRFRMLAAGLPSASREHPGHFFHQHVGKFCSERGRDPRSSEDLAARA